MFPILHWIDDFLDPYKWEEDSADGMKDPDAAFEFAPAVRCMKLDPLPQLPGYVQVDPPEFHPEKSLKVLYMSMIGPILLQVTGYGAGPVLEAPPLVAIRVDPQPSLQMLMALARPEAIAPSFPPTEGLEGWPKVLFLSPDGPVVLFCTGWGAGPPKEQPPIMALRMDPQPPIVPIPTGVQNTPPQINVNVIVQPVPQAQPESPRKTYTLKRKQFALALYDEGNLEVFKFKIGLGALKLYDNKDRALGFAKWPLFSLFDSVCVMYVGKTKVGTVTHSNAGFPRPSILVDVRGYKFTGDALAWSFEIANEAGNPILRTKRDFSFPAEKFTIDIYQPDHTVPGLLIVGLLFTLMSNNQMHRQPDVFSINARHDHRGRGISLQVGMRRKKHARPGGFHRNRCH